jgi:predicted nucleic-acid-binding protein
VPTLDTNVLVRLLVGDDADQARVAGDSVARAIRDSNPLFVPLTVLLELEWVLRVSYGYAKTEVLGAFSALLEARELEFQDEGAVERALHLYRVGGAAFAECLHLGCASAAERLPLWTFDRRAARLSDVLDLQTLAER